ncbi:hypothetical protein BRC86_03200 [Halobacteriales archaeon QS_3_64_16]|nr:MAG: hypothetical protein BRC86_03200 [Halobacteriales archaeon QS_3_64_16]
MATLDWIGVALAVLLGIAYLPIALGEIPSAIGIAFLLAGLGYFGAIVLVLAGYRRRQVYAVGIGYNLLLIALYFLLRDPSIALGWFASLGGIVKIGQAVFAAVLGVLLAQ